MESRDLVSSARPKEAELGGGRAEPEEKEPERAGLGPALRGDEVIGDMMGERWGSHGEGEGLEEQEFSIKEASFQEGSLKLKIQTTKRTKKPPKSLENYICPPEIRMTIRPPSGEGRGGRLGGRAAQDKGPPRKRTYERPFRAAEPKEGGLLQLLGDVTPPKHQSKPSILHTTPLPPHTLTHQPQQQHTQPPQLTHQHTHSPAWATPPSASPANPVHTEPSREPAGANRSLLSDLASSFLKPPMKRVPESPSPRSFSPSPQRPLSPDLVLPVVTDASILNLTSLSRGRGLQEASEQLFGNIKRKYGRKDPQRTLGNTHNAELPWGRMAEKDAESLIVLDERQKYRREETPELEREERESIGRTRKEEERESIGRTRKEEERESIGRTRKEEERESIGRTRKEEERESIGRTRKEEERESIGRTRKEEERESIGRTRKEEERESIRRTRKEEERESIGRTRKEEERESIGRTRKEEERESIGRTRKEEERESIGRTRKEEERESIGRTRKEEERESIGRTRKEEERESIGRTRKEEERESIGRTRKEEERESIGRTRKEEERESIGRTRKEEERESIGRTRKEEERESIGKTRKEEERESIGRTRKEEERESIGRTRKEEERESIGRTRKEEERESIGRTRKEEEREMPMLGAPELMEEGIGRKRRRRQCLQESLTQKDQSEQLQGTDITERSKSGPPEPKVAHKMEGNKIDSPRSESRSGRSEEGSQLEADGDRGERGEKEERADKGERTEIGEREEKGVRVMSGANMESAMIQSWMRKNPVGHPRSATDPHKHPDLNPSPRLPSPNPNHIPSSRSTLNPNPRSPNLSRIFNPNPNTSLKASPNPSLPKTKDRWSYLKSRSLPNLVQRESGRSPLSTMCEPPSAFPITPSSPLYTNTDSLTVHTPAKRKRGRPKKQPLLTVETIHEGTSTSPLSPLARDSPAGLSRRRKTTLSQIASGSTSPNINELKLKRGEGAHVRPVKRLKLGKVQSILNEILSCSSQHGSLALKSASAPVSSAMTVMASTIEARLGKQINVSKRGTIYIGKKRGRKPRSDTLTLPPRGGGTKPPVPASMSSLYNRLLVPSSPPLSSSTLLLRPHTLSSLCHPSPHGLHSDATMPSLQPISALPSKPLGRGLLGAGWKLSPPRLLANSPSHLSEGAASIKEVTLSPISESHSEETIPSDSGIGTDNNSTSDQTEKGTNARRRYSFDLCGFEAAESAVLQASSRGSRGRCEQPAVADNFLSHQEKKQKHRRKRKCLQSRDHLNFLSELEEVVVKLQQLHVSHRRYASCYPQQPYPSIFRLNFHHHYYPLTYDPYPCDPAPYLRRTAELKTKRRRGRPAKTSEPITSKLPFVQGFGYPLAGGNYYAPYAMPYAPPLSLGYYTPSPPLYLPHHPHGPSPPSPFMRPAVPPPKFHSGGHSKLQASSGPLQGSSGRGEGLGSLGGGGLGGVRLHKRKHKHKHKHKEETNLLSPHDRQELGGLFSGAKTNGLLNLLTDRWEMTNQKRQEKQRGGGRGSRGGSRGAMFESNPLSSLSVDQVQFRQRTPGEPVCSFVSNYSSQSLRPDLTSDLFRLREEKEEGSGHGRRRGLAVFGEEGVMSFHNARKEKIHEREESFHTSSPTLTGVPGKRRYKRHEVEQIHGEVRRMCSLNNQRSFEHVQKILRGKRLQRQAKTGNNVVKRRPGRPRKHPIDEFEPNNYGSDIGRGFGMPVLEKCVDLPGKRSLRPSPAPQPLEFSNHDSISVAIETVVHRARSLAPPLTRGGKRRGRPRKEEGGDMAFH